MARKQSKPTVSSSSRARQKATLVHPLQVAILQQRQDVARRSDIKLCSQTRLSEPRRDRSALDLERFDDGVDVVVVRILARVRRTVEVVWGQRALRVGRVCRGNVRAFMEHTLARRLIGVEG